MSIIFCEWNGLACNFEAEAEEPMTHEYPGSPELFELVEAFAGNIDVAPWLSQSIIHQIETECRAMVLDRKYHD